jgi:hypothetical protein
MLEDMGYHLQRLITHLAKYDIETKGSPLLERFEIELFDFRAGSAVPAFRLVPSMQGTINEFLGQRDAVAVQVDKLLATADAGNYEQFFGQFNLEEVRYEVAQDFNKFTASTGNSPITVVKPVRATGPVKVYDIKKFSKQQSDYLLKAPGTLRVAEPPQELLALIRKTGRRNKIIDLYEGKNTALSFAPTFLVTLEKVYHFHSPLLCIVIKENDHFVIQNEMLDIYASGSTIDEAEMDFAKEFDASYNWFKNTPDDKLSERLLRGKRMMENYIKEITDN